MATALAPTECASLPLRRDERWYVVQTLVRREMRAAQQLETQGFRVFLPQMAKTTRHARRVQVVRVAVFPGYLFVALDVSRDRWRVVNSTVHVARLIMGKDLPMPVPNGVVEALMTSLDAQGLCCFGRHLKQGDAVRVIEGPFAQFLGQVASLDDKGRARVLLQLMGGAVMVTLGCRALQGA